MIENHILLLIIIMTISGLLGGLVNYSILENKKGFWKFILLGVAASFTVPLFLNMISSNLLIEDKDNYLKLLVFSGFCIIASVFSKSFLESISSQITQKVSKLEDELKSYEETSTEIDQSDIENFRIPEDLRDNEIEVMKAISKGKYTYRSLYGISKNTSLKKDEVNIVVGQLMKKGYLNQKLNTKDKIRWYLTIQGRVAIGTILESETEK